MEPQNPQTFPSIANELSKKYYMIPYNKLLKYLQKANGNVKEVESRIIDKQQKLVQKSHLSQAEIQTLRNEFPSLGLNLILRTAKKYKTIEQAKNKLQQMKSRPRMKDKGNNLLKDRDDEEDQQEKELILKKGQIVEKKHNHLLHHRKQKYQKFHKCSKIQQINSDGVFLQLKKIYPSLEDYKIRDQVSKLCRKLDKILKQQTKEILPEGYAQNIKFICQQTGQRKKQVQIIYRKLDYNMDGTLQYLLSQQNSLVKTYLQWPSDITTVYIDGNNLLYSSKQVRRITLKEGKNKGSLALCKLVNLFNKQLKLRMMVVFDDQKTINQYDNIKVLVSKPKYSSTDDYFVQISQNTTREEKRGYLFVTSDQGLLERLSRNEINGLMRTKVFFKSMQKIIANFEQALISD